MSFDLCPECSISIHALREEGDAKVFHAGMLSQISIHALREEGDISLAVQSLVIKNFYPRPPRGGRRDVLILRELIF